ncbi:hypothetical protein [Halosimplex sp. J119]
MSHRIAWVLAFATAVGFLGWITAAVRRDRLRSAFLGRGRGSLVGGIAVGAALALPTALLLTGLPVSVNLPATGGFLAIVVACFAVLDRGYVSTLVAIAIPVALLRFASLGCDTPTGVAATCVPPSPEVAAAQAAAGALAVSALGYLVGRGVLAVRQLLASKPPAA